jgi:uncharacterized membrane protein YhaH (DUF805 family)
MLAIIILNVIYFAVLESPTFEKQGAILALQLTFQSLFMFIFWVEMLIKIIAIGFRAYITNGWNIIDFLLNIYGYISPEVAHSSLDHIELTPSPFAPSQSHQFDSICL